VTQVISTLGFELGCISSLRVKQFKGLDWTVQGNEACAGEVRAPNHYVACVVASPIRTLFAE
jgi:hypothetical protein